jgi:hypothetical protein
MSLLVVVAAAGLLIGLLGLIALLALGDLMGP